MPTPFDDYGVQDAERLTAPLTSPGLADNRRFVRGDHWQAGAGWVGASLTTDHPSYAQFLADLQRLFVSQNLIAEGIERHRGGVLGKEPAWDLVPEAALPEDEAEWGAAEQATAALMAEADAALTSWWDRRGVLGVLARAVERLLYDDGPDGAHVVLRLFVPRGALVETETGPVVPAAPDLAAALDLIWLDVPEPEQATLTRDDNTMQEAGVYAYRRADRAWAEITYLDDGQTVIRVTDGDTTYEQRFNLRGHLFHYQLARPTLLTAQVRQLQRLHNKALTMLSRNLDTAGFQQKIFVDASPPSGSMEIGPLSAAFIQPSVSRTELGEERIGSPSLHVIEPVSVETFTDSLTTTRLALMEELDQLHTLMSGDATASGKSRQQALADFLLSLRETKREVEGAIRWLLETALALAAIFASEPGRYDALRAEAECRLDLGPIDPETMRVVTELVDKKMMSRERGMGQLGIDDPQAELSRIATESAMLTPEEQATIAKTWTDAGASLPGAAAAVGLDEETLATLTRGDVIPPVETEPVEGIVAAATPANIEATEGLNGAQIRAALEILAGVQQGTTGATVATELLIALGIAPERAAKMVADTERGGDVTPPAQ